MSPFTPFPGVGGQICPRKGRKGQKETHVQSSMDMRFFLAFFYHQQFMLMIQDIRRGYVHPANADDPFRLSPLSSAFQQYYNRCS